MTRISPLFTTLVLTTSLAAGSVLAGPGIGPENAEQYAVSRQETLRPLSGHPSDLHMPLMRPVLPAPSHDAHSGPSFDPSVN